MDEPEAMAAAPDPGSMEGVAAMEETEKSLKSMEESMARASSSMAPAPVEVPDTAPPVPAPGMLPAPEPVPDWIAGMPPAPALAPAPPAPSALRSAPPMAPRSAVPPMPDEEEPAGGAAAPKAAADPEPASKDFHTVEVFYATDRKPESESGTSQRYGKERNREGPMEYGRTEVSIPKHHQMGIIERPKWYKLEFSEDPKKHVMILKLEKMTLDQFFGRVDDTASGRALKEALLFIHGFNVPFDQAVRRTAQISFDLDFGGVALTFSWPSQGVLTGYIVDESNAEWAVPHLTKFLVDLQEKTDLDKIHVIAHSMGTRLLSYALAKARDEGFKLELNNVILAAPDIDADVFKEQILPKIRGSAQRLTMYASSGDSALQASQEIHGNTRLGLSGEQIMVLEGMDTVDASRIDTSLLGHSYYGSHKVVMEDILELIIRGLEPTQRKLVPGRIGEWDFKDLLQ